MGIAWWQVAAGANAVVAVAYLAIAGSIARGLLRTAQWRHNHLALATATIFLTCAVHHGSHAVHMFMPTSGHHPSSMRAAFDNWFMGTWDVLTAMAALWYWQLRRLFPALVRGAALFDDLELRRRHALTLHDGVVQGLATAKLQLELGDRDEALEGLRRTLEASKEIITDLLVAPDGSIDPSVLRPDRPTTRP